MDANQTFSVIYETYSTPVKFKTNKYYSAIWTILCVLIYCCT